MQKIIKKSNQFFHSYDHKCTAGFFYETVYITMFSNDIFRATVSNTKKEM